MNAPRILQFGSTGQVGLEMIAAAREAGIPLRALSRAEADFATSDAVVRAVRETDADIVVNAVAYNAVDKAESEPGLAHAVNADTVGAMAEACAARRLPLIHISTNYVFDGLKPAPYAENDPTGPLNVYGRTKLAGEKAVAAANPAHVILRTSWVYSVHGNNFVKTILDQGAKRGFIEVADDQRATPTSGPDLVATIFAIARQLTKAAPPDGCGVFHYTGAGETTRYEFAGAILDGARAWMPSLGMATPIPSSRYPTPAKRPALTVLDCGKIERVYGIAPVPWRAALTQVLDALRQTGSGS